jgi:hypothetical protein
MQNPASHVAQKLLEPSKGVVQFSEGKLVRDTLTLR